MSAKRTPPKQKARELAGYLRHEQPDYNYLKKLFHHLRQELEIEVPKAPRTLPQVPSAEEIKRFYDAVWAAQRFQDIVIVKTFLYTGVRVGELVSIRLEDVDLAQCQIRIDDGKGGKDRLVPFPDTFKDALGMHMAAMREKGATHLFESSWKRPYSERGIRQMIARYAEEAGVEGISPHKLRHFFLLWLKKQGIDDALIQPYSGHASRLSLEVYSQLAIREAQAKYDEVMDNFPI
jgi:integrase/recombinase XerD